MYDLTLLALRGGGRCQLSRKMSYLTSAVVELVGLYKCEESIRVRLICYGYYYDYYYYCNVHKCHYYGNRPSQDVITAYIAVRMKRMHMYENIPSSRYEMTKLIVIV